MTNARTRTIMVAVIALAGFAAGSPLGCTTGQKKQASETALDAMSTEDRRETFEAAARVIDEHPELVPEIYAVIRQHPRTMDRILDVAAPDLADEGLARRAVERMVKNPAALEQTLVQALEGIARVPEARRAVNRALASRAEVGVDIVTDDPTALGRMIESLVTVLSKKPKARQAALLAVRKHRGQIVSFVKHDTRLAKEITEELIKGAVEDKPMLDKILRSFDVIDKP